MRNTKTGMILPLVAIFAMGYPFSDQLYGRLLVPHTDEMRVLTSPAVIDGTDELKQPLFSPDTNDSNQLINIPLRPAPSPVKTHPLII